jgi:membrane fusion protein, copper/silver efflux system
MPKEPICETPDKPAHDPQESPQENVAETAKPSATKATEIPRASSKIRPWWVSLVVQPLSILAAGALIIVGLGVAQRTGWISTGDGGGGTAVQQVASDSNTRYICPMMCTPPQAESGRCPVCAMELVASTSGGSGDGTSIEVDAASRRVAGIQTVAVKSVPLVRKIRTIGEICYDEGTLTTISAYVDGRIDALYADYTGVVVSQGDHLALLYSPEIYSAEVELLESRKALRQSRTAAISRVVQSQQKLHDGARQKLLELGMTTTQLKALEQSGEAEFRMHLCAPQSGTVIEKLAEEGEYVKTGQPIYRLADLSTVWLMLELFPEDAAVIRYGQKVTAQVQSLPGKQFTGRVAFIDPIVASKTRTVGVRVVFSNDKGMLRIGDYARASIEVAVTPSGDSLEKVYDSELAGKWISPRHPHVIEAAAGACRICGTALVAAEEFGFVSQPTEHGGSLVVPRNAVLMAGASSVLYVETEPGRFEVRKVLLGPCSNDQAVILKGVKLGEQVALQGNFLLDSQMQLAGNPSLIDPTRLLASGEKEVDQEMMAKITAALEGLSPEDRALVEQQKICPVTEMLLGSMGPPVKVDVMGLPIFICCQGCNQRLQDDPPQYLANLNEADTQTGEGEDLEEAEAIAEAFAKLTPEDRRLAETQKICPVTEMALGSMGVPIKVDVLGQPVFICCEGCRDALLAEPEKHFAILKSAATSPTESEESLAIAKAMDQLSPEDRRLAERQKLCPVTDMPLGSMGVPIKVDVRGQPVFICCEGCRESLLAETMKYLAKLTKEAVR